MYFKKRSLYNLAGNLGVFAQTINASPLSQIPTMRKNYSKEHFFYTVVSSYDPSADNKYYLISGIITDFSDWIVPGSGHRIEEDFRLSDMSFVLKAEFTCQDESLTVYPVITISDSQALPASQEIAVVNTSSIEEHLDSVFTESDVDYIILSPHTAKIYQNNAALFLKTAFSLDLSACLRWINKRMVENLDPENPVLSLSFLCHTRGAHGAVSYYIAALMKGAVSAERNRLL
jgi:hypothetical protein